MTVPSATTPSRTTPAGAGAERVVAPQIEAVGLCVDFTIGAHRQRVLHDISLAIPDGSIASLIGPSGCGKSTLLKAMAGLVQPSEGYLTVGGQTPAQAALDRTIGFVFQEATLLPWKSALENAAFLLRIADPSISRVKALERARHTLSLVGLGSASEKRPDQLSGGMRQRVAIARALALDPRVLLMDEPFGALDAITREEMSELVLEIWERTRKTIVLVTHSMDEAVFLSSDVHVMGIGPATIIETLPNELPYPRGAWTYDEALFHENEGRLRALLMRGHGARKAA